MNSPNKAQELRTYIADCDDAIKVFATSQLIRVFSEDGSPTMYCFQSSDIINSLRLLQEEARMQLSNSKTSISTNEKI